LLQAEVKSNNGYVRRRRRRFLLKPKEEVLKVRAQKRTRNKKVIVLPTKIVSSCILFKSIKDI
jgi:hypothetical protein